MYLNCFVLGDVIEVHAENRIRNLSKRKTTRQAVWGLWLSVAVFGGMSLSGGCLWLSVAACDCLDACACGGLWLCKAVRGLAWVTNLIRFLPYFVCKSMVTKSMFVPNAISAVFRM